VVIECANGGARYWALGVSTKHFLQSNAVLPVESWLPRSIRVCRSLADFANLMARAKAGQWNVVALDVGVDLSTAAG
jgi:hypothetical protein